MLDPAPDMVYNGIAYSVKRLAQRTSFSREVFGRALVTAFCRSLCIVFCFHSLLLRGGALKSLGLSFMTRCTVLPYFTSEHGFSQVQVTIPPAKLILGHLNFVQTKKD